MSVQSEIDRIITAVGNAYSKVSEKGGTVPSSQTVAKLATAIDSIPAGGASLNIDFGTTPPSDTSKLWVPLAIEPSAVKCSPILNYGPNTIQKLSSNVPSEQVNGPCVASVGKKVYILGGAQASLGVKRSNKISVLDTETGLITTKSEKLPIAVYKAFCAAVGRKIYIIGGRGEGNVYKAVQVYDTETGVVTQLSDISKPISTLGVNSCVVIGNKIYIMGYSNPAASGTSRIANILVYDTDTQTLSDTGAKATLYGCGCAAVGDEIYCFPGRTTDGDTSSKCWKYNINTNTVTNLSVTMTGGDCSAQAVGNKIFIFNGRTSEFLNTIYEYDVESETLTQLGVTMTKNAGERHTTVCGLDIYVLGGIDNTFASYIQDIYKFSTNTELGENNLFLQSDFGFSDLWTAINGEDAQVKIHLVNAYLGDSNNIAQLKDAYLYDSNSATWKSLDGISMTADMLTALATLGVT